MEMLEYQKEALKTALFPDVGGISWIYPAMGLAGEAGEVSEKLKKVIRDFNGELTAERREEVKKELGDVLWYTAVLSHKLGIDLEDVAWGNIKKLRSRQERNVIKGEGDNR